MSTTQAPSRLKTASTHKISGKVAQWLDIKLIFPVCVILAFLAMCLFHFGLLQLQPERLAMFLLWLLCGVLPPALSLDWDCEHPLTPLIKELWPQIVSGLSEIGSEHQHKAGSRRQTGCVTPLVAPATPLAPATPVKRTSAPFLKDSGNTNSDDGYVAFDSRIKPDFFSMLDGDENQDLYNSEKGFDLSSDEEEDFDEDSDGYMSEFELEPPAMSVCPKYPEGRSILSMPHRPIPRLTEQPQAVAARQIGEVTFRSRHLEAKKAPRRQNKAVRSRRNLTT